MRQVFKVSHPRPVVTHGAPGYAKGCRCDTCRIGYREYHNQYRRRPNRAQYNKERTLRENWNLTQVELERRVAEQNGKCKICQEVLAPYFRTGTKTHIDHDPRTGKKPHKGARIRGILCHLCNQGLGKFRDDPDRLERAAAYIRAQGKI